MYTEMFSKQTAIQPLSSSFTFLSDLSVLLFFLSFSEFFSLIFLDSFFILTGVQITNETQHNICKEGD